MSVTIDAEQNVTVTGRFGTLVSELTRNELTEYNALRRSGGMLQATREQVTGSGIDSCPPAPFMEWDYGAPLFAVDEATGLLVAFEAGGCVTGEVTAGTGHADVGAMLVWLRELGRSRVECDVPPDAAPDPLYEEDATREWRRPLCIFEWSCGLGEGRCK